MKKLAIVQAPPVFLNLKQTIEKACDSISEAAKNGAHLVMFPEAYIPGYPSWVWRYHYSRPDIFELTVNKKKMNLINFK